MVPDNSLQEEFWLKALHQDKEAFVHLAKEIKMMPLRGWCVSSHLSLKIHLSSGVSFSLYCHLAQTTKYSNDCSYQCGITCVTLSPLRWTDSFDKRGSRKQSRLLFHAQTLTYRWISWMDLGGVTSRIDCMYCSCLNYETSVRVSDLSLKHKTEERSLEHRYKVLAFRCVCSPQRELE